MIHPLIQNGKAPDENEPLITVEQALLTILFELGCDLRYEDVLFFEPMLNDLGYQILPLPAKVV